MLKAFAIGLVGFILPVAISFVFYPNLMPWFLRQIVGLNPGQHSPILESGGSGNPVLVNLVAQVFSLGDQPSSTLLVTSVLVLLAALAGKHLWQNVICPIEPSDRFYFAYNLAFLMVTLLLPRMKPYSFILAAPALFGLARMEEYRERVIILVFSTLLPIIVYLISPWLPDLCPISLLLKYLLAISLLLTTLAVIAIRWKSFSSQRNTMLRP